MRFLKCRECGHIYTGSLTGDNSCPQCHAPSRPEIAGNRSRRESQAGNVLFILSGPVYKIKDLEQLKSNIEASLEEDIQSLAFAFESTSFLDSSMLNLLVKAMHTLSQRNKPTFIITADLDVIESLHILDLDKLMTIVPTLEEYRGRLE